MNKLYYGDNLEVMRKHIRDEAVDLCYIDPPFNSKRTYNQIYNNIGKEDKAQAQAFIDTWTWNDDAIKGLSEIHENDKGIYTSQTIELINGLDKVLKKGSLLSYLVHMTQRIAEIHRILKPTGSFYLHCDPTASHYLKLVLDSVFCANKGEFQNEIIWCYKERELSKNRWNRKHDVIFFYSKTDNYTFNSNEVLETYSEVTRKKFKYKDENGYYMIRGKGTDINSPVYKADGLSPEHEKKYPDLTYRQYIKEGVLPRDWWEIGIINKAANERLGYPTQKPEALLEKIVKASSNKGDVIFDPYCGCGTSSIVAERLGRNWIGIDITYQSISLILKRMEDTFGKKVLPTIQLTGVPEDFESAEALAHKEDDRTRKEFEKWFVLAFSDNRAIINEKKGGDGGIDGIAYMMDRNKKGESELNRVLFSVKSDKVLSPKVVRELNGTIEREGAAMGYLLTLYPMKNLIAESKKYGSYHNTLLDKDFPKIEVISVQEMLDGKRITIPTTHEIAVTKSAEEKGSDTQHKMELE